MMASPLAYAQFPSGPLLPPNSTPFEYAYDAVSAARYPLPADLIRAVWSPDDCPAHLLGYLAWAFSVDLWDDAWSETKKRAVIRQSHALHRSKTTLAGIRAHLKLVDAEIVKVERPGKRHFLLPRMDEAERERWLNGLPQIRIYPFSNRGTARPGAIYLARGSHRCFINESTAPVMLGVDAGGGLPLGGTTQVPGRFVPGHFMLPSRGKALRGRRAAFVDPKGENVERPISISLSEDGLLGTLSLRKHADARAYLCACRLGTARMFTRPKEHYLLSFQVNDQASSKIIAPGLRPAEIRPHRIMLRRRADKNRAYLNSAWLRPGRSVMFKRNEDNLFYDRVSLVTAEINKSHVSDARLKNALFLNYSRFQIAPFTAELRIRVPQRRPAMLMPRHLGKHCFMTSRNAKPFWRAVEAVRVSKALRDKILITATTTKTVTFAHDLRFGEFTFGNNRKVF